MSADMGLSFFFKLFRELPTARWPLSVFYKAGQRDGGLLVRFIEIMDGTGLRGIVDLFHINSRVVMRYINHIG